MEQDYFIIGRDVQFNLEVPLLKLVKRNNRFQVLMFMPERDGYSLVATNHQTIIRSDLGRSLVVVESYRKRKNSGYTDVSDRYVNISYGVEQWHFTHGGSCVLSPEGGFVHGALHNMGIVVHHAAGVLEQLTDQPSSIPV